MGKKYFLSVSNGRTGSTWLETCLGSLGDVAVDYEFKWRPRLYKPQPVHIVISDGSFSARAALDGISNDAPVVGSKLVLDLHHFLGPGIVKTITSVIESDINIVHLSRDYFSTLLSWRTREVFNAFNDLDERRLAGTAIYNAVKSTTVRHDVTVNPLCVVRGKLDERLLAIEKRLNKRPGAPPHGAPVSFDRIVNDLLTLFHNDLICREIVHGAKNSVFIRYGEIGRRFGEITKFVGSEAGADEIASTVANPVTRRIGGISRDIVRHATAVERVARCLDKALDDIVKTGKRMNDVWIWSADGQSAVIRVPGLKRAVTRGRSLLLCRPLGENQDLVWQCRFV